MAKKTIDYKQLLNFGSLATSWFYKNFFFVFFIFVLILLYIANVHYAEKKVKEIQHMQREIRELRGEYMSVKSKVMYQTMHSELSKVVGAYGLGVTDKKPYRIVKSE
jgi:predicted tellurium resistance membrane protein TerC